MLFVVVEGIKALVATKVIFLRFGQVGLHHLIYHLRKGDVRFPAQLLFGPGRVAEQGFYLGRPEIAGIDPDNDITGLRAGSLRSGGRVLGLGNGLYCADFLDTGPLPGELNAQFGGGQRDKVAH